MQPTQQRRLLGSAGHPFSRESIESTDQLIQVGYGLVETDHAFVEELSRLRKPVLGERRWVDAQAGGDPLERARGRVAGPGLASVSLILVGALEGANGVEPDVFDVPVQAWLAEPRGFA